LRLDCSNDVRALEGRIVAVIVDAMNSVVYFLVVTREAGLGIFVEFMVVAFTLCDTVNMTYY
jgi:hypothetical protein